MDADNRLTGGHILAASWRAQFLTPTRIVLRIARSVPRSFMSQADMFDIDYTPHRRSRGLASLANQFWQALSAGPGGGARLEAASSASRTSWTRASSSERGLDDTQIDRTEWRPVRVSISTTPPDCSPSSLLDVGAEPAARAGDAEVRNAISACRVAEATGSLSPMRCSERRPTFLDAPRFADWCRAAQLGSWHRSLSARQAQFRPHETQLLLDDGRAAREKFVLLGEQMPLDRRAPSGATQARRATPPRSARSR